MRRKMYKIVIPICVLAAVVWIALCQPVPVMKALAHIGLVDAKCTVTFNKRLSLDELDTFLQRNEIYSVDGIEVRLMDLDGARWTALLQYRDRERMEAELQETLHAKSDPEQKLTCEGVIDAFVRTSPKQAKKIAEDAVVYSAEWSAGTSATGKYGSYPPSHAWDLEEKGRIAASS